MTWDFFISHASEDKADIARPLAEMLQVKGFKVWYDEYTLTLGDNLRQSIEHGLAQSQYGVVVLSPNFFAKKWTNLELDGLFALEKPGKKRILPVWHKVSASDVESFSSFLAMRLGVRTADGLDHVVEKIVEAISREAASQEGNAASSLQLHPHSIQLLQTARDANGRILANWYLSGFSVTVGSTSMGHESDPRAIALNLHCLDELTEQGLVLQKSDSLYVVTQEGYDFDLPEGVIEVSRPQSPRLTSANQETATQIMQGAVAGNGRVNAISHLGGHALSAGSVRWDSSGDRRLEARWESVLDELVEECLLLPRTDQAYLVTHLGYLWTDELNLRESQAGKN